MKFSQKEKKLIQEWYQFVAQDSQHYGNGAVLFPHEAILLKKLTAEQKDYEFTPYDIELIIDWMQANIKRQFGDAKYLMGDELSLYQKLTASS